MLSADKTRDLIKEKRERDYKELIESFNTKLKTAIDNNLEVVTITYSQTVNTKVYKRFIESLKEIGYTVDMKTTEVRKKHSLFGYENCKEKRTFIKVKLPVVD